LESLINMDQALAQAINSLVGHVWLLDELAKGLANDYFLIISINLGILYFWFSSADFKQRDLNQRLSLQAMASLGIATGLISILNQFIFRPRPFDEIPVTILLYQPTDSSFPANSAAILFAVAMAFWMSSRKVGGLLFMLAIAHSLARVYAGMYYPLDILGGAAIGIIVALAVRWLFSLLGFLINWLLLLVRRLFIA
jgi:undecaprenyl-diphosphatase